MVKLSKRMKAIANFVSPTKTIVDIGTDHGFLPIFLVETKVCQNAIAMDVNQGPLERAKVHICECNLMDKIQTRRSDGLAQLKQGEGQAMIIAGMGGPLMMRILREGVDVARSMEEIVLQPQSELEEFRKFLCLEGYDIVDETMVLEDGKYYNIWKVIPGLLKNEDDYWKLSAQVRRYGSLLIEHKNPIFIEALCKEEQVCKQIQNQLNGGLQNGRLQNGRLQLEKRETRLAQVKDKLLVIDATKRQMI